MVYKESFLSKAGVFSSIVFGGSSRLNLEIGANLNALVRYSVLVAIVFVVFTIFTTA